MNLANAKKSFTLTIDITANRFRVVASDPGTNKVLRIAFSPQLELALNKAVEKIHEKYTRDLRKD